MSWRVKFPNGKVMSCNHNTQGQVELTEEQLRFAGYVHDQSIDELKKLINKTIDEREELICKQCNVKAAEVKEKSTEEMWKDLMWQIYWRH